MEKRIIYFRILQELSEDDITEILNRDSGNNRQALFFFKNRSLEVTINKFVDLNIDDKQFYGKLAEKRNHQYLRDLRIVDVDLTPYLTQLPPPGILTKEWYDELLDNYHRLLYFIIDYIRRPDFNYAKYFEYIEKAIRHNKHVALQALWSGIYYLHSQGYEDTPYFLQDLKTAAQYANLNTFKYCLYGFWNYEDVDPGTIKRAELEELAKSNPYVNVRAFIATLPETLEQ